MAGDLSLVRHGTQLLPGLAIPLLGELVAIADRQPPEKAGVRIVGDKVATALLSQGGLVGDAVARLTNAGMKPVRAVLFDKSDGANWALGWHQDRTIAVRRRVDAPGFGPWSTKQGFTHVEPPFDLIACMATVRIHLDRVDAANGPLRVILGSHLAGRVPAAQSSDRFDLGEEFTCRAEAGDVWVYSTPILHASRAAAPGGRRRVLQVDYSADPLPHGLEWLGV